MAEHMLADPIGVPRSLPSHLERGGVPSEMYSYPGSMTASEADADWMEEEDWLLKGDQQGRRPRYGSDEQEQREIHRNRLSRTKPGRQRQRMKSTTVSSLTRIFSGEDNDDSSDKEEPPLIKMIYRRSRKDIAKLVLLPSLYFVLMVLAFVFAFYTIEGLMESYNNRVRSVQIVDVQDRYNPIGIAVMPQFSEYQSCDYRYYDDVSPHPQKPPSHCDKYQIPIGCINYNITFNSTSLSNVERYAMVFKGPTLVACKESIAIRFLINATEREFSAVEYILFENWYHFEQLDDEGRKNFLANKEATTSIYTFPAGFRTWVKMSYSVRYDMNRKTNVTDFTIIDNYASYNDPGLGNQSNLFPMEVLFEWKSNQYEYIKEIISTTAWSAFGSICGVFITLVKAGEFGHAWIRRIRRDRQKKVIHLQQLEEEQKKKTEEYEQRQRERRETKLRKSLETTQPYWVKPIN